MKLKSAYSLLLLPALLMAACSDPFEGQTFITPTTVENEMTCTVLLEKRSSDFSLWIELLKYADYYNGLKDSKASATVFAPTNRAMEQFLAWKGVRTVRDLDRDYARYVAQNHILSGVKINSETFINYAVAEQPLQTQTLFMSYLRPAFGRIVTDVDDAERTDEKVDSETLFVNNQAAVQPRDSGGINFVEASNAIIYYMDDVIHPLAETMVDKLEEQGEYKIFAAACRDCGYDSIVSRVRDTLWLLGGGYTIVSYQYTCFAPNDAAMNKAGIYSLTDLRERCRTDHPEAGDKALWNYVAYHFMDRSYTKSEFCSFNSADEILIYDTSLKGEVLTCANDTLTNQPCINEQAQVIRSDIEARNGYIHKIDYYLPVWAPQAVTVRWDLCNSPDIIAFVNAYGADKNLGPLYSNAMTNKDYQIDLSENFRDGQFGEITSFTYQANQAKASYSNYRAVGFKKCKYTSASKKDENPYGAWLNNLLVLNLGYAGWIQFTTPTIIRGKYKVTLHYASEATMRSFHSAGSLTKFQIDPELNIEGWTKNAFVFKGLPTTGFSYGSGDVELFSSIEFDESGTHQFKATMLDINAKTSGSYHQLWDYVLFTPIE
ncbi:MAG: DUF5108 domain-containing protein [Bacteroidales bacterium]|nr:DUF5108 domain-containing protein [Bacteroidales bacterium]